MCMVCGVWYCKEHAFTHSDVLCTQFAEDLIHMWMGLGTNSRW